MICLVCFCFYVDSYDSWDAQVEHDMNIATCRSVNCLKIARPLANGNSPCMVVEFVHVVS